MRLLKITIEGTVKEIADLAVEAQNRLKSEGVCLIRKPYSNENIKVAIPTCAADEIPVLIRKPYSDEITVSAARKFSKPL